MPRTIGQAIGLWVAFVFVFLAFGGLGAGLTSLIFELFFVEFSDVLYAVVFGAHGIIAYQILIRWFEHRS